MTQHPLTIPDGWTVELDQRVEDRFRDADFYEALVATITTPSGHKYYVEADGSSDLHHEDRSDTCHQDFEFRLTFPHGKLPRDGLDGWVWHSNKWFDVYDEDGHVEDSDCVAHDVWEAIAKVFELPDPVSRGYVVTYSSMPVTATSPSAAIARHAASDSGGGEWQAHPAGARLFRVLDLSTAHLPQEQMQGIAEVDTVVLDRPEYGALVWVDHDDPDGQDAAVVESGFPDLVPVLKYARTFGGDLYWVQFDRDADSNDALPSWDW